MRGFERFKVRTLGQWNMSPYAYGYLQLTHGSFATILGDLGQQALELQLERFWTVWAWSWDLEESPDFTECLGMCHSLDVIFD